MTLKKGQYIYIYYQMWKVVKVALITPLGPEYMIKALDDDLIISVYEEELREITHRVIETETDLLCELYG